MYKNNMNTSRISTEYLITKLNAIKNSLAKPETPKIPWIFFPKNNTSLISNGYIFENYSPNEDHYSLEQQVKQWKTEEKIYEGNLKNYQKQLPQNTCLTDQQCKISDNLLDNLKKLSQLPETIENDISLLKALRSTYEELTELISQEQYKEFQKHCSSQDALKNLIKEQPHFELLAQIAIFILALEARNNELFQQSNKNLEKRLIP